MNAKISSYLACVAVYCLLTVGSSAASAQEKMPGLSNEVKILSVAPGQTIFFEVDILRDLVGPDQKDRGISLWFHKSEKLFAWWGTFPHPPDPKWDAHGGLVDPTVGGRGGAFRWKNEGGEPVDILVNSWHGHPHHTSKCSHLKLWRADEDKKEFEFRAGEDDKYNKITLKVRYINPQ